MSRMKLPPPPTLKKYFLKPTLLEPCLQMTGSVGAVCEMEIYHSTSELVGSSDTIMTVNTLENCKEPYKFKLFHLNELLGIPYTENPPCSQLNFSLVNGMACHWVFNVCSPNLRWLGVILLSLLEAIREVGKYSRLW